MGAPVLQVSTLGLYDDARFPGRSILRLNTHRDGLEQLSTALAAEFMGDIQKAITVLKTATGAERINVAILGNAVTHVHAHLIPRKPELEPLPHNSPWDDTREKVGMEPLQLAAMIKAIKLNSIS